MNMTHQQKLEAVRQACIKAGGVSYEKVAEHSDGTYIAKIQPIQLASVLLAMNGCTKALYYGIVPAAGCGYVRFVYQDENAGSFMGNEPVWWLDQSLEQQSAETVSLLYELLK